MNANLKMIVAAIALASSASAFAASDMCGVKDAHGNVTSHCTGEQAFNQADSEIKAEVGAGVTTSNEYTDAAVGEVSNHLGNVEAGLTTGLQNETAAREDADKAQQAQINATQVTAGKAQQAAVDAYNHADDVTAVESQARVDGDAKNAQAAANAQDTANDALTATGVNAGHIAENTAAIQTNSGNIESLSHSFAGYQADANHRMDGLQQGIDRNSQRIEDTRKDAFAGVAGAMAQGSIPQVVGDQKFAFGAGVGTYESESAIAVGGSARITDNVTAKASVSADSQSNFGAAAGLSIGW